MSWFNIARIQGQNIICSAPHASAVYPRAGNRWVSPVFLGTRNIGIMRLGSEYYSQDSSGLKPLIRIGKILINPAYEPPYNPGPPQTSTGEYTFQPTYIEAAVKSVGGSLNAMFKSSKEIARLFSEAFTKAKIKIEHPAQMANIVGQCAQETAWFRTTEEFTAGNNWYSPYDGRGFIQLTHRGNYAGFGAWMKSLGIITDENMFVNSPSTLAQPQWAAFTAAYYFTVPHWQGKNLMKICTEEKSPWHKISAGINAGNPYGGYVGGSFANRAKAIDAIMKLLPAKPGASGKGQQVVDWIAARLNKYYYTQGPARLNPEQSGGTDCSGMIYFAYLTVLGMNIGTWGGAQVQNPKGWWIKRPGQPLNLDNMRPGDLVFYTWSGHNPVYDHTEIYAGGGRTLSHGGPGRGPNYVDLRRQASWASEVGVKRFVE